MRADFKEVHRSLGAAGKNIGGSERIRGREAEMKDSPAPPWMTFGCVKQNLYQASERTSPTRMGCTGKSSEGRKGRLHLKGTNSDVLTPGS